MAFDMSDYNDVSSRIVEFREQYPDGCLQSEIIPLPDAFADSFIAVKASAYRSPQDERPGIGLAYEPVPGKTNFTRDSELQNAETAAWGRAIIAVGAADAKKGIASKEEVQNRQGYDAPQQQAGDPSEKAKLIPMRRRIKDLYPEDESVKDQSFRQMSLEQLEERYPKAVE